MRRIYFDKFNKVKCPTMILQNKSNHTYGKMTDFNGLVYKRHFNSPNEISFTFYNPETPNLQQKNIWDNLADLKIIYIPEYEEKFELSIDKKVSDDKTKAVTGTSLAEAELAQILLRNIEINTEIDIENDRYDTNFRTIFYRDIDDIDNDEYIKIWNSDKKYTKYDENGEADEKATIALRKEILRTSSLLHRITEKAVNYSIGHVDDSLKNLDLIKSFSIDKQSIYDELTGEIADEYGVLFLFDSMNRTINAYDLYNTCYDCGHREDFTNICPKCGSVNIGGQYGKNTAVLVSDKNLATDLQKSGNPGSVKTYFKIEGGDDLINATVAAINPTGTSYIFYLPDYMLKEMPQGMRKRLSDYDLLKKEYLEETNFLTKEGMSLSSNDVTFYNQVVEWLSTHHKESIYPKIGEKTEDNDSFEYNNMVGYDSTTELYYDLMEIESIIQTSLSPTITIEEPTISETFELIDKLKDDTIAVSDKKSPLLSSVDNAVLGMVKATINTSLYKPEITVSSYSYNKESDYGEWTGVIKLTNLTTSDEENPETMEREYVFEISDDIIAYTKQKIQKNMARIDINEILKLTSLEEETYNGEPVTVDGKTWLDWFKDELEYYSIDNLTRLQTEFATCQSLVTELHDKLNEKGNIGELYNQPAEHYISLYSTRLELINDELSKKESMLSSLHELYYYDFQKNVATGKLPDIRKKVNDILNFKNYLMGNGSNENYYPIFCNYLREDTYQNSNYISTNLDSNKALVQRAKELIDVASKEIQKSAYNQYTISSTMNNLFALDDFEPIKEDFEVGNWIRVDVDGDIHKLRLLSYNIDFDNEQNIDVEFSTVEYSPTAISDKQSVMNAAMSMATTYDAVIKQVNETSESLNKITKMLENGIDSSSIKIVNDSMVEDIVIDKNGILGRAYDDITGKYDQCQFKIVRNGMYMTNDNWQSIYNAIGKFNYDTGEKDGDGNPVYQTAYGIKADSIIGNLIFGNELKIKNEGNTLTFDKDGLFVEYLDDEDNDGVRETHKSAVTINPSDSDGILFKISSDYNNEEKKYMKDVMYVDSSGNGHFDGIIDSESGSIGGWEIKPGALKTSFEQNNVVDDNGVIHNYNTQVSLNADQEKIIDFIITDHEQSEEFGYDLTSQTNTYINNLGSFVSRCIADANDPDGYYSEVINEPGMVRVTSHYDLDLETEITAGKILITGDSKIVRLDYEGLNAPNGSVISNYIYANASYTIGTYEAIGKSGNYAVFGNNSAITRIATKTVSASNTGYSFGIGNGYQAALASSWEQNADIYLCGGQDSTSKFLRSYPVYSRTYDNAANVVVTSNGTLGRSTSSSIRYKHDVEYYTNIEQKSIDDNYIVSNQMSENNILRILDIPVVSFKYNKGYITGESDYDYDKPVVGFIADDVAKVCPECATYITVNDEFVPESWNERQMIPRMLYVIQKHEEEIRSLKNENEKLQNELNELKETMGKLIQCIEIN